MNEVYRAIAAQQRAATVQRIAAYVRASNPGISVEAAEELGRITADYFQMPPKPMVSRPKDQGYFVEKAKEWGKGLVDPDHRQKMLDERERKRNAPIEREFHRLKVKEHQEHIKKQVGDVPQAKTHGDVAKDLAGQMVDKMRSRVRTPDFPPEKTEQPASSPAPPPSVVPPGTVPSVAPAAGPSVAPQEPALHQTPPTDDEDAGFDHSQDVINRLRGKPRSADEMDF